MGKCGSQARDRDKERASLLSWDYISLGLGWTRYFFKIANQLPKLLQFFFFLIGPSFGWTDKPLWPRSFPCTILTYLCMCFSPRNLVPDGEESFNSLVRAMIRPPQVVKLQLSGEANRLVLPGLLNSMCNFLCPFY